jgi:hypothetical protein
VGVRTKELPISAEKVLAGLRAAGGTQPAGPTKETP